MDSTNLITQHQGKPVLLEGPNFSGRTSLLRHWCANVNKGGGLAIYVGPDVHQAVSSLVPTVRDELLLHAADSVQEEQLLRLAAKFGLERCLDQNPFTLSGGEQVLLVTSCKLGMVPRLLALDGTFEQLDRENSGRVIDLLCSDLAARTTAVLTANGYAEDRHWQPADHFDTSEFSRLAESPDSARFEASDFRFTPAGEAGSLEVQGISFAYTREMPLLRDIHFKWEPGHVYSLEGRNGVGKSTLARILTGMLRLRHGRIVFNGQEWNPWKTPGRHVVMHLQNPDIQLFADSVKGELADVPGQAAATFAGVSHLLPEHPFDLPFVLRKRLTFSAVAHLSKSWFIFDEPTLGQDAAASDQIVTVLKRMAEGGAGVIVISHSAGFIRRLNPRRFELDEGRLRQIEPPSQ